MGQLGNVGYGLYKVSSDKLLVLHARGSELIFLTDTHTDVLDKMLESAVEEDKFWDHKINMAWGELEDDDC